jgi:hypothetical protein
MSQHKCPFKQGEEPTSKIKEKNLIRRQSKNLCFLKGAHKLFQFTGILLKLNYAVLGEEGGCCR